MTVPWSISMFTVAIGSSHSLDLGPCREPKSLPGLRASIVLAICRARRLRRLLPCAGSKRYANAAPIAAPPMRLSRFTIGRWRGRWREHGRGLPGIRRGRIRKSHRTWFPPRSSRCKTRLLPSPGRCTTRVRIPSNTSGLSGLRVFPLRAALKTEIGAQGFQTELASRSGNPAGSIVASGVIVTKFLAHNAVSVAGSVPAEDDPTTNCSFLYSTSALATRK